MGNCVFTKRDADHEAYVQAAAPGDPLIPYKPEYMRYLLAALWPAPGVLGLGQMLITSHTPVGDMSIDVKPGTALVTGATSDQKFFVHLPDTLTVPLSNLVDPSGTVVHKVYLAVYDSNAHPGTGYGYKIWVAEDTGGGAGTPNDNPAGYLLLGTITHDHGVTAIASNKVLPSNIVAGRQTSWVNINSWFPAGIIASAASPPQLYRDGKTVRFRGGISRTGNVNFIHGTTSLTNAAAVPSAYWPERTGYYPCALAYGGTDDHVTGRLTWTSAGLMQVLITNPSSCDTVFLDGISYMTA